MKDLFEQFKAEQYDLISNNFSDISKYSHLDAKSLVVIGISHRKTEKIKQSLSFLRRAKTVNSIDPHIVCEYAVSLFHNKEMKESLEAFDHAIALDPKNPFRYSSRAYVYSHLKMLDEAIADYEKALALDPADAIAHNNLGLLLEQKGRKDQAQKSFDQADELSGGKLAEQELESRRDDAIQKSKELDEQQQKLKEPEPSLENEKLSATGFFQTIGELFKSKKERKLFWNFLKNGGKLPN